MSDDLNSCDHCIADIHGIPWRAWFFLRNQKPVPDSQKQMLRERQGMFLVVLAWSYAPFIITVCHVF